MNSRPAARHGGRHPGFRYGGVASRRAARSKTLAGPESLRTVHPSVRPAPVTRVSRRSQGGELRQSPPCGDERRARTSTSRLVLRLVFSPLFSSAPRGARSVSTTVEKPGAIWGQIGGIAGWAAVKSSATTQRCAVERARLRSSLEPRVTRSGGSARTSSYVAEVFGRNLGSK
jgi:hypothetical protein